MNTTLKEKITEMLNIKRIFTEAKQNKSDRIPDVFGSEYDEYQELYKKFCQRVPTGTSDKIRKEVEDITLEYIQGGKELNVKFIDPRFISDSVRLLKEAARFDKEKQSHSSSSSSSSSPKKKTKKKVKENAEKAFSEYIDSGIEPELDEEEKVLFDKLIKKHEKEEKSKQRARDSLLTKEERESVVNNGLPCRNEVFLECQFITDALGLSPNSRNIYDEFIQSRSPNKEADSALGDLPDEEVIKGKTVFPKAYFEREESGWYHRTDTLVGDLPFFEPGEKTDSVEIKHDGILMPYIMPHQLKGFLKEAFKNLQNARKADKGQPFSTIRVPTTLVDTQIFVLGRELPIEVPDKFYDSWKNEILPTYDENDNLQTCQRTIRVTNAKGSMTSLACSEIVPAGSKFRVRINYTIPALKEFILMAFDRARFHGWSQWRNAGWGRLRYRIIDERGNILSDWNIPNEEVKDYL